MRIERSQSITSPRYDETCLDLTSERAPHPCQLVERKGHPTHECHSPTCQSLSLTHSFVHTHMIRCRCSTVRDDQHKPIQSRTGISIGIIIITTSDYLRILTHTNTVGMLVHQTTMLRPNIAINLFHWDSGTRQEVRD